MTKNKRIWIGLGIVALIFAVIPQLPYGTKDNLTLLISLFIMGGLAASWNIVGGFLGRINLGHVAFFGLGSIVTREAWLKGFESPIFSWATKLFPSLVEVQIPLIVGLLVGAIVAAIAAAIVGAPALRLKGIYFSIGTLALAEALRQTIAINFPKISNLPGPMLRGYDIVPRYYLALAILVIIVAFIAWLSQSKLGLGMKAIREDEAAARSIGINVFLHSMLAFILSAFFAGLVGGSFAYFQLSYYHYFVFEPHWTFDALIVTFIGGIGTLTGPLLGAFFFVMVRDILSNSLVFMIADFEFKMADYHLIIFGVIFIAMVLAMPGGLLEFFERIWERWRPKQE